MSRLDRRALFASGAAAALLAATGLTAQTPRPGGTLRLAVPRDGSLDRVARGAVFDTLTEIAPDGTLRGELATGWRSETGARVWHFDLRGDAVFHDGTPLRAEDAAAALADLGRAEATGRKALRLELAEPDPDLPLRLAEGRFAVPRAGETVTPLEHANGTGCYRVERARDDHHFRARKVAGHYRQGQAGWIDTLEIIVIPDAAVRAEALRDGFVDVAALPDPDGLGERGRFRYHPSEAAMDLAIAPAVGLPRRIGATAPLDDGRIAERWWMV